MTEKGNGELHGTDLEELIGQLVGAHDEEHRRIAGELHDSTAQHLTAVLMGIDRACDLAARHDSFANVMGQARALVDQSLREITALCYRLHPPLFEELGLEPALHWLVRGFEECSGIAVSLEMPNSLGRLPHQMETALFHVAETALADLRRYSGIASVELRIIRSRWEVILLVKGRGSPKRRN